MAGTPGTRPRFLGAVGPWAGAKEVLKNAELVVKVKLRVGRLPEAHTVTLADLVLFARDGGEGGTVAVLEEAEHVVGVEDQVARLGHGPLSRPHASDGEGDSQKVVAERDRVAG